MSTVVRAKGGQTTNPGDVLTITYDQGTALDNTYGHVLVLRSRAGSSLDPTPATPSGWTLAGSAVAVNGVFTARADIFCRLGDSSVNSVTIAGSDSTLRSGALHAITGITGTPFWHNVTTDQTSGNRTSIGVTVPTASLPNTVYIAAVSLSGTAGGSGFAWTPSGLSSAFDGSSSSSSFADRFLAVAAPAAQAFTATWTTSGIGVGIGAWFGGSAAAPTVSGSTTANQSVVDYRNSASNAGGTLSFDLQPSDNVTNLATGLFAIQQVESTQSLTLTISDSASGVSPVEVDIDVAAAGDSEGLIIEQYDGSAWD